MCRTIRSNSRCQGWRRGAVFSRKYSRFSCGSPSSLRRRSMFSVSALFVGPVGMVRHRSLNDARLVRAPLLGALLFCAKVELLLARISIDPMRHQGVSRVKRALDFLPAVTFLALRHVAFREVEIVENSLSIRPLLEEIVVLEEMVVTEGRVGDHQCLHRCRVFLHQIGDTG